jgi:hypothetical protein
MSVVRVMKGGLSPSIECGHPLMGQKKLEFMVCDRCRGVRGWLRL